MHLHWCTVNNAAGMHQMQLHWGIVKMQLACIICACTAAQLTVLLVCIICSCTGAQLTMQLACLIQIRSCISAQLTMYLVCIKYSWHWCTVDNAASKHNIQLH